MAVSGRAAARFGPGGVLAGRRRGGSGRAWWSGVLGREAKQAGLGGLGGLGERLAGRVWFGRLAGWAEVGLRGFWAG